MSRESDCPRWVVPAIWLVIALLVLVVGFLLCGCTIAPKPVAPSAPSFSCNAQNSGILSVDAGGAMVTAEFRATYNALIATYGKDILPPLGADAGLSALPDGTWRIDKEHLVDEIVMAGWHRSGRLP